MTEVLFYHLERRPLDEVLPGLLERSLERGWRVVVQAGSDERVEALDAHLWEFREDAFLPHGTRRDGSGDRQPVWLTVGDDNPNGATVRFLVDGAPLGDAAGYDRIVYLFDGADSDRLTAARAAFASARSADHDVTYWRENANGRWEKQG